MSQTNIGHKNTPPVEGGVYVTRTTRLQPPRLDYRSIKDQILGPDYELSLVFIGKKRSEDLNKRFRNKAKPGNVLSFPLSKTEGELFITLAEARDQASRFRMSYRRFTALLFIHGLLHLKGMAHGSTMERQEKEILGQFGL